jgi:hypothetical protein
MKMVKYRIFGPLAIIVIILALAACAGTKIVDSWRNPKAGPIQFKKVVVFFFSDDQTVRRAAEDELVRQIKNIKAVTAYTLIPEAEFKDLDKIEGRLKDRGFDGAVIMRLLGVDKEVTWVPGAYPGHYHSFHGYYRHTYPMVYDPGYLRTDQIVRVETNVYSLADDQLVWSGISETFNPKNSVDLVDDVARSVAKDLRAKYLIK